MSKQASSDAGSALRGYIDKAGDLPTDVLLGRMVLFTITDEPVAHADLEKWFKELNLDENLLPSPIRELDAFKKATSGIDRTTYPLSGDRTAHLLCREVSSTTDYVKRQITREIKDAGKKRLSYNGAVEATYYRKSRNGTSGRPKLVIHTSEVHPEELDSLRHLTQEITNSYLRYAHFHDGQKLRGVIRNYLKYLNAIEVKGGVYFIHASKDPELANVIELVKRFGGGCEMDTIPMADLTSQREFMTRVWEREAAQALQEITKEIATSKRTPAALQRLKERYDGVLANSQEHMSNLQVTQDLTAASAEVAQNALIAFETEVLTEFGTEES